MRLRTHVWTSALAALAIYPQRPRKALLLTLAGVLIDVDHYVLYALRSGDWSIRGALHYDSYRNRPRGRHDKRPRYGSLRSIVHHPMVGVSLGLAALPLPVLRPLALGIGLHLTLDYSHVVTELPLRWAAGWRCQLCGSQRGLRVHMIVHRLDGGRRNRENLILICEGCWRAAQESYPVFPPPRNGRQQTVDSKP